MALEFTGRGDPDRTLKLLWRVESRSGRGPKRGLTLDAIVAAAIALADKGGLGAVSMRAVADRLGVGTMSLYRYVPGKHELVELMVDAVHGEFERAPDGVAGWREKVMHFAEQVRALDARHPWMNQVSQVRSPLGPGTIRLSEAAAAAFAGSGLSPRATVGATNLVSAYCRGVLGLAHEVDEVARETGESDEQFWSSRASFWETYFDPEQHPHITALWEAGAYEDPVDDFAFGLARLLDGLEALAARGGTEPPAHGAPGAT